MKKLSTLFVTSMILLFTPSFAQTSTAPEKNRNDEKTAQTYFDLMVNVVSTNIHYGGTNSILNNYRKQIKGIQAGISFQAGITKRFSLVSEFYFLQRGGALKEDNPLTKSDETFRLNSLELPVLARLHLGNIYINAGPSVSYNLSGKKKVNDQSTKISFNNTSDGFKHFEAGIQMGGGIQFPFKQKRIALDIRYSHGLTTIAQGQPMNNRAIMIGVHVSKAWKTNPLSIK